MSARPGRAACLVCAEVCDVYGDRRLAPHPALDIDGTPVPDLDCPGAGARVAVHRVQWLTVNVPVAGGVL